MIVLTLHRLYICVTAIAAPPTVPILPLQNDAENPNLNATPSSVFAVPRSQLTHIPFHLTNITTNTLPPSPFSLRFNSVIGSITFIYPTNPT